MAVRPFRFHPAAAAELADAAEWYESQRSGLGSEFVDAVRNRVEDVLEAPERWAIANGVRRALLSKFPYAVVYREVPTGEVEVIAVAHLRRRPKYWSRR